MNLAIIGERLNTSRPSIGQAVMERDVTVIHDEAMMQLKAGALMLDINTGTLGEDEIPAMEWVLSAVSEITPTTPLVIDSSNPDGVKTALKFCDEQNIIINSVSLEEDRWEMFLSLLRATKCRFVGQCIDDRGAPGSAERRYRLAREIISRLDNENIPRERLFLDPVILPASVDTRAPPAALRALQKIKENHPEIKTLCGLSNVSYGLPQKRLVNRHFLTFLLMCGLDCAILDPLDKDLVASIITSEMLLGKDDFCKYFLKSEMEGFFEAL